MQKKSKRHLPIQLFQYYVMTVYNVLTTVLTYFTFQYLYGPGTI